MPFLFKIKYIFLIFAVALFISLSAFFKGYKCQSELTQNYIKNLELPLTAPNEVITKHEGFFLIFSSYYKQSKCVAYELTKEKTIKKTKRTNKFKKDPLLSITMATNGDYKKSGYDKGHLAPAADMAWSEQSMNESFYFSNISPQLPQLNRGIWKNLEELIRVWVQTAETLYVATGPVLSKIIDTIGNKIPVPAYFYKVILDYKLPKVQGIGFIIPNSNYFEGIENYAVSIDSVEKITGIDFFYQLPLKEAQKIEAEILLKNW